MATTKGETEKLTKAQRQAKQAEAETLAMVIEDFNNHWEYVTGSWHNRWLDNYKLYNNERIKRGYLGVSDTFVPMTFSTVETLTSALFGTKPKLQFLPPQDRQDQDTTILNGLIDYYWDKDQWSVKCINTGRGFIREGTAIDYFTWDIDHPVLINVPVWDFCIDPFAYELDERTTRWCGRRYLTTLDELEQYEVVDLDKLDKEGNPTGDMKPKYKNLDQLKGDSADESVESSGSSAGDQKTDKQEKDLLYGSVLPEVKDQIEVIEYWTVDRTISIANRRVVIEDTENYFKARDRANQVAAGKKASEVFPQGLLPFADARNYVDGSLFYAKGDVDFIADQQEDLNDFSNQEKDAISFNLNQQKTLDPKYKHLMQEIENLPGEIIPVEAGAYVPVPTGVIPPDAFNERMNIKNEIRETTASNEVIKGVGQTAGAKQTATEINAQVAGAGQRISLKVTQLENGYFHRMAKIVFRLIQLYVTEPMMVRIVGKDGANWQEFDPAEFRGLYEPRVQLDLTVQQKKQTQQQDAANLLKAFLNDPNVAQRELTKLVLSRGFELDPDEVEQLLVPDPTQAMPQPGVPEGMAGADAAALPPAPLAAGVAPTPGLPLPGMATTPGGQVHETADMVKMFSSTDDPAVRNAILASLGLPPEQTPPLAAAPVAASSAAATSKTPAPGTSPLAGLPPEALLAAPSDLTPDELAQLVAARAQDSQGAAA
jgi:hypothetical protein